MILLSRSHKIDMNQGFCPSEAKNVKYSRMLVSSYCNETYRKKQTQRKRKVLTLYPHMFTQRAFYPRSHHISWVSFMQAHHMHLIIMEKNPWNFVNCEFVNCEIEVVNCDLVNWVKWCGGHGWVSSDPTYMVVMLA